MTASAKLAKLVMPANFVRRPLFEFSGPAMLSFGAWEMPWLRGIPHPKGREGAKGRMAEEADKQRSRSDLDHAMENAARGARGAS
jgi:hypothetical protein